MLKINKNFIPVDEQNTIYDAESGYDESQDVVNKFINDTVSDWLQRMDEYQTDLKDYGWKSF